MNSPLHGSLVSKVSRTVCPVLPSPDSVQGMLHGNLSQDARSSRSAQAGPPACGRTQGSSCRQRVLLRTNVQGQQLQVSGRARQEGLRPRTGISARLSHVTPASAYHLGSECSCPIRGGGGALELPTPGTVGRPGPVPFSKPGVPSNQAAGTRNMVQSGPGARPLADLV